MKDRLKKIRTVKKKHEATWLKMEGVVAVGIGQIEGHGPGIVISVKDKPAAIRRQIPSSIEGIHIHLKNTGPINAQ